MVPRPSKCVLYNLSFVGWNPKPKVAFQNPRLLSASNQVFPGPSTPPVLQTTLAGSLSPAVEVEEPLVRFAPDMLIICWSGRLGPVEFAFPSAVKEPPKMMKMGQNGVFMTF